MKGFRIFAKIADKKCFTTFTMHSMKARSGWKPKGLLIFGIVTAPLIHKSFFMEEEKLKSLEELEREERVILRQKTAKRNIQRCLEKYQISTIRRLGAFLFDVAVPTLSVFLVRLIHNELWESFLNSIVFSFAYLFNFTDSFKYGGKYRSLGKYLFGLEIINVNLSTSFKCSVNLVTAVSRGALSLFTLPLDPIFYLISGHSTLADMASGTLVVRDL